MDPTWNATTNGFTISSAMITISCLKSLHVPLSFALNRAADRRPGRAGEKRGMFFGVGVVFGLRYWIGYWIDDSCTKFNFTIQQSAAGSPDTDRAVRIYGIIVRRVNQGLVSEC